MEPLTDDASDATPEFVGRGTSADLGRTLAAWVPAEGHEPIADESAAHHPAGYRAGEALAQAVNTALLLNKPLLLTGNPGTGKTELAQRIAWEFGLGAVLRFDAQSLSEAPDLFYRFDLVGEVAASHRVGPHHGLAGEPLNRLQFVSLGPLGKAILRSYPTTVHHRALWPRAFPEAPPQDAGRRSVVLIDEIDKASRDFPNDLLNAIESLRVPIRELNLELSAGLNPNKRPIIVVTSNLERELPDPFLRRCVYCHIEDPSKDDLRDIVRTRVFPETLRLHPPSRGSGSGGFDDAELPTTFEEMLDFFVVQRDKPATSLAYKFGPSELIDWSRAVRRRLEPQGPAAFEAPASQHREVLRSVFSALAKQRDDVKATLQALNARFDSASGATA